MSIVVLAEKPSVARDIARVLGANRRNQGFISGNGYLVTWAVGHLVSFAEPNEYKGLWAERWSFRQLPMVPDHWILKTLKHAADQFAVVKRLLDDPQVTEVICATDAGREGENIFRLIYEHCGCQKPFKRLWVSSLTDEAIEEGLRKLHPGVDFDDLARAAKVRAQADWLVGLNMTRAYTVRHGALYTIGRVQTPTLGMIVKREEIITQFEKVFYYEIEAGFQEDFKAKYLHSDEKGKESRIDNKAEAERLHGRFQQHQTGKILSVSRKTKKFNPPQLYDLITLQKDANRRFNLTANQTLEVAQKLYEQFKLITYPRTESRHIGEDMVSSLPRILENMQHPQAGDALAALRGGLKLSKQYVDKTKLSDHHGIIPTPRRAPATMPRDCSQVYSLVVARFVGIFLPEHIVEETTVLVDIDGAHFRARGNEVKQEGWKVVEPRKKDKDDSSRMLPPLKKGQVVHITSMELQEKETAPPKRYTDATLLTAMKNAGREVEDDALAEAMKEQGLGTPATRAEIIEKLIRTRLIERRKKVLFPTEKGMALISVVHDTLKSPELTGQWEQRLKDVENGEFDVDTFYQQIVDMITELIPRVSRSPVLSYRDPRPEDRKQPNTRQPHRDSPNAPPPKGNSSGFGSCPKCGSGAIIEGRKAYGCNRFRQGCHMTFPKAFAGKALSEKQVKDLVAKKKTGLIKGFKDDQGKAFSARVVLDEQLNPQLERGSAKSEKPKVLTCPNCGRGQIIEGKKGFGCNRFREGCKFVIWKEIAGKKLTQKQLEALILKGKTPKIKGFKNKNGDTFDARLVMDEHKQIRMDFDG